MQTRYTRTTKQINQTVQVKATGFDMIEIYLISEV